MMTSPNEWTILEWDKKIKTYTSQTNKKYYTYSSTHQHTHTVFKKWIMFFCFCFLLQHNYLNYLDKKKVIFVKENHKYELGELLCIR